MDKIRKLYDKYRHIVNYLFFGVVTTLVNWGCYAFFTGVFSVEYRTANALSWFISVSVAFFTNRRWVFAGSDRVSLEMLKFFIARALTGAFEIIAFPRLVAAGLDAPLLGIEYFPAKILVTVIVTVLNYVFSRLFVFTGTRRSENDEA